MMKQIQLVALIPHPENSNHMDSNTLKKLRRLIEDTGRYEPLTVRPYPHQEGKYQVINGHNRLRVLRAIGHQAALCTIWDVNDDQTRLYLATLNRLGGKDLPERRSILIETLLGQFAPEDLAALLPDKKKQIEKLQELTRIELDDIPLAPTESENSGTANLVAMEFIFEQPEADEINLALDLAVHESPGELSRSQALLRIARFYLRTGKPIGKAAPKRVVTCNPGRKRKSI